MLEKETLWQSENWKNFQSLLGNDAFFIKDKEQKILIICKQLLLGKTFLEIQRGNLTISLYEKIKTLAISKKAIFLRISPNQKLPSFLQKKSFPTNSYKFPTLTSIIDLKKTEEEIFSSMSQSGRRHIRLARKKEVKIIFSQDTSSLAKLIREMSQKKGIKSHDALFFKKLLQTFSSQAFILLAQVKQEIIAGGIFIFSNQGCTYLYGGSKSDYNHFHAPTLLQWEAIKYAKKSGKQFFDFLGIAPQEEKNHPWSKISQFKRKFKGQEITLEEEVEIPFNKMWFAFFRLAKKILNTIK